MKKQVFWKPPLKAPKALVLRHTLLDFFVKYSNDQHAAAVVGEKSTENVLLEGVTYIFIFHYTRLLLGYVVQPHFSMLPT